MTTTTECLDKEFIPLMIYGLMLFASCGVIYGISHLIHFHMNVMYYIFGSLLFFPVILYSTLAVKERLIPYLNTRRQR